MVAQVVQFKPYLERKRLGDRLAELRSKRIDLLSKEREFLGEWEAVKRENQPTGVVDHKLHVVRTAIRNHSIEIHDIEAALAE